MATKFCFYCGEIATTKDHLLPIGWFEGSHKRRDSTRVHIPTVNACASCNSSLGDRFIPDIVERLKYIGEYLVRTRATDERIAFNARVLYQIKVEGIIDDTP